MMEIYLLRCVSLLLSHNDGTHFGGCLSLSGSTGHAPLKHADCFGAIDPKRSFKASHGPTTKVLGSASHRFSRLREGA